MAKLLSRRTSGLWLLMALLAFCSLFFFFDAIADLMGWEIDSENDTIEAGVVGALLLSLALTAMEIKKVLSRQKRLEDQVRAASGAFIQLVEEYFEQWVLTPSEKDVALLALKGLSITEIAQIRETKEGTIKAQSNAIYRKAGVTGRPQLLSIFIEDLLAESLINGEDTDES